MAEKILIDGKKWFDFLMVLIGQSSVSLGNFLSTVIIARALGLDEFGFFSMLWLIVLFFNSITMGLFSFPLASNYYKVAKSERVSFVSGTIVGFLVLMSGVVVITFVAITPIYMRYSDSAVSLIMQFSACLFLFNLQDLMRRVLIVVGKNKISLLSDCVTHFSRVLFLIGFSFFANIDTTLAINLFSVSAFLGVISTLPWMRYRPNWWDDSKKSFRINIALAKWLLPSSIMQWTSINLFISAAAYLISPAAVGVMRACQSLLAPINIFIQAAESTIPVKASDTLTREGVKGLFKYLTTVTCISLSLLSVVLVLVHIFGADLIAIVFGKEFETAESTLLIYSIAYIFLFLIVPVRAGLRALGKGKAWFNAYVASSLFSLLTVYFLEINFGVAGAVWGILLAHVVLIAFAGYFLILYLIQGINEIHE